MKSKSSGSGSGMEQSERVDRRPGAAVAHPNTVTTSTTSRASLFLRRLKCTDVLKREDIEKLEGYNVHTVKDLLSRTVWDVHEILGTATVEGVRRILEAVAKEVAPTCSTARIELRKNWVNRRGYLRTCLEPLDSVLDGGIRAGVITEIVGPAGLGKTQYCLQMSVIGCLDRLEGDGGRIFYIDTEKKFSGERLSEIAKSRFPESFLERGSMREMLERVIVQAPNSTKELVDTLQQLQGAIIGGNIVLIIIDSIASMFRSEFGPNEMVKRQEHIGRVASTLKSLAESFNIPVLVTNQITTKIEGSQSWLAPALGTAWSHAVNTRITMSADVSGQPGRSLRVSKSSFAPTIIVPYHVTRRGLEVDPTRQARFACASEGTKGLYTEF